MLQHLINERFGVFYNARYISELLKQMGFSYQKAKTMVKAGKGEERGVFGHVNQERRDTVRAKARVFLSYFDPEGPAVWDANIAKMKADVPLLWVVGNNDRFASGRSGRVPRHPKDDNILVPGGHLETPSRSFDVVALWLRALKCEKPWCGHAKVARRSPDCGRSSSS